MIFYASFLSSTLLFWDVRYLCLFLIISLVVVFTSGIRWTEMSRAWIFIGGFVFFFALLTFLTGRGGMEVYSREHLIAQLRLPLSLFGWVPP